MNIKRILYSEEVSHTTIMRGGVSYGVYPYTPYVALWIARRTARATSVSSTTVLPMMLLQSSLKYCRLSRKIFASSYCTTVTSDLRYHRQDLGRILTGNINPRWPNIFTRWEMGDRSCHTSIVHEACRRQASTPTPGVPYTLLIQGRKCYSRLSPIPELGLTGA